MELSVNAKIIKHSQFKKNITWLIRVFEKGINKRKQMYGVKKLGFLTKR